MYSGRLIWFLDILKFKISGWTPRILCSNELFSNWYKLFIGFIRISKGVKHFNHNQQILPSSNLRSDSFLKEIFATASKFTIVWQYKVHHFSTMWTLLKLIWTGHRPVRKLSYLPPKIKYLLFGCLNAERTQKWNVLNNRQCLLKLTELFYTLKNRIVLNSDALLITLYFVNRILPYCLVVYTQYLWIFTLYHS